MSDAPAPLPMAPTPCWRCGAPSQRPESRYALCLPCLEMIAEIATLHQRPVPASGAEDPPRGEDFNVEAL